MLSEKGKLECECCGFDFEKTYGALGSGFIECHHIVPLNKFNDSKETKLEDYDEELIQDRIADRKDDDNEVEELPEFLKKRRKLCIEMNPLKLSIKKEFSIISPYLIIRDFPKSYKFSQLWTDKEKDLVKSFTEKENNDTQVNLNFIFF